MMDCIKKMRLRICNVLLEMTFSTKKVELFKTGRVKYVQYRIYCKELMSLVSLLLILFITRCFVIY